MAGLPKLPGYTFSDPTITKFHITNSFDYVNGFHIPRINTKGLGGKELDIHSVGYIKNNDPLRYDPSLTYGRARGPALPQYKPHFALYDQKCLTFRAFFKQSVFESPDEYYRVRQVNIIYFLEDDSITVMEPFVRNCGFKQGRLVKRGKIPKTQAGDFWHWKDFNVGIDMCFNGIVFHTVDCDGFTREYMASQGMVMNPSEDMPPDPYTQTRELKTRPSTRVTPQVDDKLRRFLEYDGKILKFNAVWDNRMAEFGEMKEYVILYFLADDTVSVKEVHTKNDGCDPTPLLLRKLKLPKNWTDRPLKYASIYLELSDAEVTEYYQPKDFKIGETIFILGRRFLLFDCDAFTRTYYEKVLNISLGQPIKVFEDPKPPAKKCMPPHGELGLGSLEDSLQNCFQTIPTIPKRDEVRMVLNANKYLRYTLELDWVHPEDSIRKFILLYSLANGTCQIYEPPIRNSGIIGGKFLKDSFCMKPGSHPYNPDFYTPADFYVGAIIHIHGHRFKITGADLRVYRYMQANPEKIPSEVIDNMRNYMFTQGFLTDDIQESFTEKQEVRKREDIAKIGQEMKVIKTEREKCLEQVLAKLDKPPEQQGETEQLKMVVSKEKLPYTKAVCERGIKPLEQVCTYPVVIEHPPKIKEEEIVCPVSADSYTVTYPETEEEKLKKYYDSVLKKHEEACLNAYLYKKDHECLPGTVSKPADSLEEKPKEVFISDVERPQPHKDSPCITKHVTFTDPSDRCLQTKDDVCGLTIEKTHKDCVQYTPLK